MRGVKQIAVVLVVLAAGLGALYFAMAERVEVVVLRTRDAEGDHATRLWIVDDASGTWLRTGADNATWLQRLRATPAVRLERRGATQDYQAVVLDDTATVERVNALTLEKYGWSEQLLRALTPGGRRQVAIRLDPP